MHVLVDDDLGRLTLRPIRPWHRMLARSRAVRLDRELAGGADPEQSAFLAVRATQLTSAKFRRDLAASLRRMLAAAADPQAAHAPRSSAAVRSPAVPLPRARISQAAAELGELADYLLVPGPVPARGVAMVSQLLADGRGPLYHRTSRADLRAAARQAAQALAMPS